MVEFIAHAVVSSCDAVPIEAIHNGNLFCPIYSDNDNNTNNTFVLF